jgi:hypothetical protein
MNAMILVCVLSFDNRLLDPVLADVQTADGQSDLHHGENQSRDKIYDCTVPSKELMQRCFVN